MITELNQRLPTVAEALVKLKAFRFLEVGGAYLWGVRVMRRRGIVHGSTHTSCTRFYAITTRHWMCAAKRSSSSRTAAF